MVQTHLYSLCSDWFTLHCNFEHDSYILYFFNVIFGFFKDLVSYISSICFADIKVEHDTCIFLF